MRTAVILGAMLVAMTQLGSNCKKCGECDDALEHMAGKLPQFGCDPSIMEDAQDRIRNECADEDTSANAMIGGMVESCHGSLPKPDCQAPLAGLSIAIDLRNDLPATAGIGDVGFTVSVGGTKEIEEALGSGATKEVVVTLSEGDTVEVLAEDLATGEPLVLSEELTTRMKVSPGDWTPYRKRQVALTGDGTFFELTEQNW